MIPRITRKMLERARKERGIAEKGRAQVEHELWNTLFRRFRTAGEAPISGANQFTDELVGDLLRVYGKLRGRFDLDGVNTVSALWELVIHVFVPTVFLRLWLFRDRGLGAEFRLPHAWYLSDVKNESIKDCRKPVPRVLDYLLRVAGLRTAYGLARSVAAEQGLEKTKKAIQRWLSGKSDPSLEQLLRFIERVAPQLTWLEACPAMTPAQKHELRLGESPSWRARLRLAYASQRVLRQADVAFEGLVSCPSVAILTAVRMVGENGALLDDDGVLWHAETFFSAILVRRRLERQGLWMKTVVPPLKPGGRSFGPAVPESTIAAYRKECERNANPGNRFVDWLREQPGVRRLGLETWLLDQGVDEINRLLPKARQKAGGLAARRPRR